MKIIFVKLDMPMTVRQQLIPDNSPELRAMFAKEKGLTVYIGRTCYGCDTCDISVSNNIQL